MSFMPLAPRNPKVKIDKRGVKNAQKNGYDWKISFEGERTTRCDFQRGIKNYHIHTYKITLEAVKKGGATPLGIYFGEAYFVENYYSYDEYLIPPYNEWELREETDLWTSELSYAGQKSAKYPYLAEGMLFAATPGHQTKVESIPLQPLPPISGPLSSPFDDWSKGLKREYIPRIHVNDLNMRWTYVRSVESKRSGEPSFYTSYSASAGEGFFGSFDILIENNAVKVTIDHCSSEGPVTLTGGRLTKRLRK